MDNTGCDGMGMWKLRFYQINTLL